MSLHDCGQWSSEPLNCYCLPFPVSRVPPVEEHLPLFGPRFAAAIRDLSEFAILYTCDIPLKCADKVEGELVPRLLQRTCHACRIYPLAELLKRPVDDIAEVAVKLVELQREFLGSKQQQP
jgi:hypothetical protein